MQLYVNIKPDLPDGGPFANMNPGSGNPFGIITFGDDAYVSVKTDDEARRIIAVAARLIEMRHWIGRPHAFERAAADTVVQAAHCSHCGMLRDSEDHDEPEPRACACCNEPVEGDGDICDACPDCVPGRVEHAPAVTA